MAAATPAHDYQQHWIRISSKHFSVLTDGGEKRGTEVLVRFEQMRAVFGNLLQKTKLILSEPTEIVAYKSREEYSQAAPVREGRAISRSGFFLAGKDRNYIVLDLSDEEDWRPVSAPFARVLLNYNYPPAQAWFDEGLVGYFSSLRLDATQAKLGEDPAGMSAVLTSLPWLPITKLFAEASVAKERPDAAPTVFQAESWIVMHYLFAHDQLSETGAYLALVEVKKLPVEHAIQNAYGVSPTQFEESVKDYFRSLPASPTAVRQFPAPVAPDEIGTSNTQVTDTEALSLLAEMRLRMPEHREQAVKQLEALAGQPQTENVIQHRALAWAHLQSKEYDAAMDELAKGDDLNHDDAWTHFYSALVKYDRAHDTGEPIQGLANMMIDLRPILDWDPDFAEAYNMLGVARLQGGGLHAATDSQQKAIELNPRDQSYVLNLAQIDLAAKKWDEATVLLNRLKDSSDPEVASAATQDLADLPTLKKYGILPQRSPAAAAAAKPAAPKPVADETSADDAERPKEPALDRRKSQYLKGKLVSVDCSRAPVAILKIATASKLVRFRTADYKSLLLVGSDNFSCDWKNVAVVVNYKAGGIADGDLVSLELP